MILGLASPTYSGILPAEKPVLWLLERCVEYDLRALEASLPLGGTDDPQAVGKRAADLGITWVGYWNDDFVRPAGGAKGLWGRAEKAFDVAVSGGVKTLVIFGAGSCHNRFTREPPPAAQFQQAVEHLRPMAEAASVRGLQLGLLPHLDYRGHEMVSVMQGVDHPALKMAFDTANPFPVCEEPEEAAKVVLPQTVAVALKDVQIFPHRSNDVTIWGTPIGQGAVNFGAILPMLNEQLPDPDRTTVSVKLRLPRGSTAHDRWMKQSLVFLRSHPALV